MTVLTFEAIRRFCQSRPVELTLAPCERADSIALHADFEGNGDFFSIHAEGVEYVQLIGRCWIGGVVLDDWHQLSAKALEWQSLRAEYSGRALVMWASDEASFETTRPADRFVIVASRFVFTPGSDWTEPEHQ
jgi:hypothetical protein